MDILTPVFFGILFLVMSILFHYGKGLWLIAGFNTMEQYERKKYDMKAVGRLVSKILLGLSASQFLFAFGLSTDNTFIKVSSWIIFTLVAIFALIYARHDRFKK